MAAEAGGGDGVVDVAEGGEDEGDVLRGVAEGADLVADGDEAEADVVVVADVVLDPGVGVGLARGEPLEVGVGDAEDELDGGAAEGLECGRVRVVDSHPADVVLVVEGHRVGRGREVVPECPVAHARLRGCVTKFG